VKRAASRALLVGVEVKAYRPLFTVEESLDELELLAQTAGVDVRGRVTQRLSQVDSATFIGSGKLREIAELLAERDASIVIFDDELSPRHQREIEKVLGEDVHVLDRSALILDIFAQHARTREGALQVELAQYEYRLPRLTRQWAHLARQAGGGAARGGTGGVGLRGPGETQLEVDRRDIGRRIARLKRELEDVRAHRQRHRTQRARSGVPTVALVGYTNAGKSTLLNALSGAEVYVADQLFATLDPTTRRVELPSGRTALFSDTVGFIQKLPVQLVAAFRATLEEVVEADLLLHVVDASHPQAWDHVDIVEDTLAELEAARVPKILVLNKVDLGEYDENINFMQLGYQAVVRVSALRQSGLDELLAAVDRVLLKELVSITVLIPYEQGDVLSAIYESGVVEEEKHTAEGVIVSGYVPLQMAGQLQSLPSVSDSTGEEPQL
jgi:GTPase